MSTCIAIEQHATSLTLAVVERRPGGAVLTMCDRVETSEQPTPADLEKTLCSALPGVRFSKAKLVVVVGASDDTQLRRLDLPPAPPDELPTMVRMLSAKELSAAEEDAVDFLPIRADQHGNSVVAARLSEARLAASLDLVKRLDATLGHVVLRACASAALAKQLAPETGSGARLVVAPAAGSADFVVFNEGEPVLIRSLMSADADGVTTSIKRTLPAASQVIGGPLSSIVALGAPAGESTLNTLAGDVPMRVIDPSKAPLTAAAFSGKPEQEWAPLAGVVGAALDAASGHAPAIDFVNPRQASRKAPERRRQVLLAAMAAVAVLAGVLMAYGRLAAMDQQIVDLNETAARFDESANTFKPYQDQVARLDAWSATDVIWLDELEQFGRRLRPKLLEEKEYPADKDVYLTVLLLRPPAGAREGGQIEFDAAARNASILGELEQRLRDERHEIQPISVSERSEGGDYPWAFKTLIRVDKASTAEGAPNEGGVAE